jgi:hypothetical protein
MVAPPPRPHGRGLLIAGAITAAVGGVVTVAGIPVALAGAAENNAAHAHCSQAVCDPAAVSEIDAAHTKTTAGWIMLGIGAPVLVAGVVMVIVGATRSSPQSAPSARQSPVKLCLTAVGLTSSGVVLGGTF